MNTKGMEWVLRIAVAGEFVGHGVFALQGKMQWVGWIQELCGVSPEVALMWLSLIGAFDLLIAFLILVKPIRAAILWAVLWGFWTALLRPVVGEPIWDFIERWANWGAPLALLMMYPHPRTLREWFRVR